MDLANSTNGIYDLTEGWIGPERSAEVRDTGAVYVADEVNVFAYYYLGFIDKEEIYATRLGSQHLTSYFYTFYVRRGEPWKPKFDTLILWVVLL